jgi:hypothetical protein
MGSFRQEPYLWVHLAGLATVPLWLDLCLVGLATGIPRVPPIIELALLVLLGSGPILWMQWRRPFSIFSLLVLVLPPDLLTEDQRRILRLFKSPTTKALSLLVPLGLTWTLLQLYRLAPIAASVTPLHTGHTVGFLVALISFLACNLFIQVPLSVLRVLAVRPKRFALVDPYPVEEIPESFTMLGLRVNKILPEIGTVIQPEAVDGADSDEVKTEPVTDELAAEALDTEEDLAAVDSEADADDLEDASEAENAQDEAAEAAADLDSESLENESLESDGDEEDFGDDPDEDLDADFGDSAIDSAVADASTDDAAHEPSESPESPESVDAEAELVTDAAEVDAAIEADGSEADTDAEGEAVETAEVTADASEADTPVSDLEAEDSELADPADLEAQDPEVKDSEAEDFGDDPDENLDADFRDEAITAAGDMVDAADAETAAAEESTEPTAEADKEGA